MMGVASVIVGVVVGHGYAGPHSSSAVNPPQAFNKTNIEICTQVAVWSWSVLRDDCNHKIILLYNSYDRHYA